MLRFALRFLLVLFLFAVGGGAARADISLPAPGPRSLQVEDDAARVVRGGQVALVLRAHYGGAGALQFAVARAPAH